MVIRYNSRRNWGYELPQLISHPRNVRRLNFVMVANLDEVLYGGVATALRFLERMSGEFEYTRLVLTHQMKADRAFQGHEKWTLDSESDSTRTIAFLGDEDSALSISENDVFVGTFWTTVHWIRAIMAQQQQMFPGAIRRFVDLIQDYEPGFYPRSAHQIYAEDAYSDLENTIGVFNSGLLSDYFHQKDIRFKEQYVFEPKLNPALAASPRDQRPEKEKIILVYGRPSQPRNGFEVLVESLRLWAQSFPTASEWRVVSVGEKHIDVPLASGVSIQAQGKLSLAEYADYLSRAWVGISLMISPHPSYPPLEMAEFGCWTITNHFANKDLSTRSPNIISVAKLKPELIADRLKDCCSMYSPGQSAVLDSPTSVFYNGEEEFPFCSELVASWCGKGAKT